MNSPTALNRRIRLVLLMVTVAALVVLYSTVAILLGLAVLRALLL